MTAEAAARRTCADATLADYRQSGDLTAQDRAAWADRLAAELESVLAAPEGTGVRPDGSGVLSPADLLLALAAIEHAAESQYERARQWCDTCSAHPAGACESCIDRMDEADAWTALAARLGEPAPASPADRRVPAAVVDALAAALFCAEQLQAVREVIDRGDPDSLSIITTIVRTTP